MAVPLLALAGIGAAQSGLNFGMQALTNRSQQRWNEKMYGRQRADALHDWTIQNEREDMVWGRNNEYMEGLWNKQNEYNERLWHMQNEYDSPMAQMARFKEAGLNPNLIYGQSNTGASIQTANHGFDEGKSGNIRPVSPGSYSPKAPQFDLNIPAMQESAARTNNLEALNKVYEQDAIQKATQTVSIAADTARKNFDLGLANELRPYSLDAAKANLENTLANTSVLLSRNEREAVQNTSNLREAAHRMAVMRGTIINNELDRQLKQLDMNLKGLGIQPSDNLIFRIIGQMFNAPILPEGVTPKEFIKSD